MSSVPHHLGIIMDGNRRWARARGLPVRAGHMAGAMQVEAIAESAYEQGIDWLTLFAFSTENWKRPKAEIADMFGVFRYFLAHKAKALLDQDVRLRIIGDMAQFPHCRCGDGFGGTLAHECGASFDGCAQLWGDERPHQCRARIGSAGGRRGDIAGGNYPRYVKGAFRNCPDSAGGFAHPH